MTARSASLERKTRETDIEIRLDLDGEGRSEIETGIRFLDHLLDALVRHGRLDLQLRCVGDRDVDDHHTAEDCALALGTALDRALGERRGIERFGAAYAPMDEALARAAVDLSGRPFARVDLGLRRERLGELACENVSHFFSSLAVSSRSTFHVELLRGENDHHRAEAAFKALALALRQAIRRDGSGRIPSTKGVIGC